MNINGEAQRMRDELERLEKTTVKVALFGQPGAGKSSLINKIVGEKVAEAGVETDKTIKAARYEFNGLELCDLPGYGTSRFPKETFFDQFDIPSFDLFLCVTSGKFHDADSALFQELKKLGKVCIFVVNKHDDLWEDGVEVSVLEARKTADIRKQVNDDVNVLFTSCRTNHGLDALQKAIEAKLVGAKRERWTRVAAAYSQEFLDEKRAICERMVTLAAGVSAANGLNPIPGVDVSVDLGVLHKLFAEIRAAYGLTDNKLNALTLNSLPVFKRLADELIQFSTKQGLLMLLKRFASRQVAKSLTKYIPLVGQAIAAGLGFAMTKTAGDNYLDDCHKVASELLRIELRSR